MPEISIVEHHFTTPPRADVCQQLLFLSNMGLTQMLRMLMDVHRFILLRLRVIAMYSVSFWNMAQLRTPKTVFTEPQCITLQNLVLVL
jgi:hypothetical protein